MIKDSSGFWKENLTLDVSALACGLHAGPALAPVTREDQRGHGGLGYGVSASSPPFVRP